MSFSNVISRTKEQALVPEVISYDILKGLNNDSVALQLFRQIPMATNQTRMPVLAALPTAYFVSGDTGIKQTTEMAWTNKYLNVEELAAIIPIPENVLDDTAYDVWGAVKPLMQEALARALDAAIIFGVNKPSSWPSDIATGAVAAGNVETRGTNAAAAGGLAGDLSSLFGLIEADGYDVTGIVANRTYRGLLRNTRTTFGQELMELSTTSAYGIAITYPMRGLWPTGSGATELVAGDFTQGILGVRKDITYKVLDQAVIQDNTGAIMFNLAQQDMVALRVTMRVAYQIANTLNYDQPIEANRFPFGIMHST
ncbi:MAG: phage major capsid protein [Chloroflexota bacterium]|nr:phage major capsid protein [Chloroflexota bacterium]